MNRTPDNQIIIESYLVFKRQKKQRSPQTIKIEGSQLNVFNNYIQNKSFKDATQDDMLKWEEFLQKKLKLTPSSIEQYESHVKRFYKYYFHKEEYKKGKRFQKNIPYHDNVSWISTSKDNQKDLPLEKLIDEKDLLKLLNTCEQPRDQAMISAGFFDAGLRIGELISLNVRNVGFDKLGGYFYT